jgi:hypothetical protein
MSTSSASSSTATPTPKKAAKIDPKTLNRSSILAKMQSNFNLGPADDDDDGDDAAAENSDHLTPYVCGFCADKFSSVEKLEGHVDKNHKDDAGDAKKSAATSSIETRNAKKFKVDISGETLDEITDDFVTEIENENVAENGDVKPPLPTNNASTELSRRLVDKSKIVIVKPTEKNWQVSL